MASSLDNTTNLTKMNNKHHIALTSLKNKLASSKAMLIQKNNETKEMKLEIEKMRGRPPAAPCKKSGPAAFGRRPTFFGPDFLYS